MNLAISKVEKDLNRVDEEPALFFDEIKIEINEYASKEENPFSQEYRAHDESERRKWITLRRNQSWRISWPRGRANINSDQENDVHYIKRSTLIKPSSSNNSRWWYIFVDPTFKENETKGNEVCGKSFSHRLKLLPTAHLEITPHKCNICSRSFKQKHHLNGHLQTHTQQ